MNLLLAVWMVLSSIGNAAERAHVYDHEPVDGIISGKPYYEVKIAKTVKGKSETFVQTARNAQGKLYSEQTLLMEDGKIRDYSVKNVVLNLHARVRVDGSEVHYESDVDGKKNSGTSALPQDFVAGPASARHVEAHYADLDAGKTVTMEIGIPAMARSLSFELSKVEAKAKETRQGQWIKVRMKPSSMVISAIMPAAHYYIDKTTHQIVRYVGPTEYVKPGEKKGFVGTVEFE